MKYLLLLFFLLPCSSLYSQSFTYTGNVNENGEPLPGASICISGTITCTSSDLDGNYSIQVNPGDELIISYIGMETQHIKITGSASAPVDSKAVKPLISADFSTALKQQNDTLQPSEPSGTIRTFSHDSWMLYDVVRIKKDKNNVYSFLKSTDHNRLFLEGHTGFTAGTPIRLQNFQNLYAQGSSLNGAATYRGPETNEVFSWGPGINTLQTSDNSTPYYPNGNIVTQDGNGGAVPVYGRNRFFRNTFEQKTGLSARLVMPNSDYLKLDLNYHSNSGSIPTAKNDELSTTLTYDARFKYHKFNAVLNYNRFENQLSNSNFIYNKAIFANAITPAHFNNKAGALLPDGLPRNFSTAENNPYYLLGFNRDENNSNVWGLSVTDFIDKGSYNNTFRMVAQLSDVTITGGNIPFAAQVGNPDYNRRNEKYHLISIEDDIKHIINYETYIGVKLNLKYQDRDLNRNFYEGFASLDDYPGVYDNNYRISKKQQRAEASLNLNAEQHLTDIVGWDDELRLNAATDISYSSTYKNSIYAGVNGGFTWRNFIIDDVELYGNAALRQYEPDLQMNNLNFNSLNYYLSEFKAMRNNNELFSPNTTATTRETTYTAGAHYYWLLQLDLELYRKNVSDMYAPVNTGNAYTWMPAVDYKQKGLEFTASYTHNRYDERFTFTHSLNFTTYKNKVTGISHNMERIPYAGFADVNKNYVLNQPLGAIVGSVYQRDANNNIVIGADGYPLVADAPAVVGNPNPDFILGYTGKLRIKRFNFTVGFDWSKGGDLWNGTQQTLNYYGVSQQTAQQRGITGYVFNGVTQNGQPNTQPVSFYDTNQPVSQNRWVRYGVGGVAEDAIEDASFFRLNNITMSYICDVPYGKDKFVFALSAYVNNVFIISKSKTAFSDNALFNSAETSGLEYFNAPLLRTYGLTVAVKF